MHRIYAISDLHLGGMPTPMLGAPRHLIEFLQNLSAREPAEGETRELVIHGDFVDFLSEPSRVDHTTGRAASDSGFDGWTPTESDALAKLEDIIRDFKGVFAALGGCARRLGRLTILLGNHDIELALPRVRDRLLRELGTSEHCCRFIDDNQAYRVGDVLIEHGNRYDSWNAIDHDGLRREVSAASRGEINPMPIEVCPGSRLVSEVLSPLKKRYHFIDLLKPEDKIVSLLLLAIEPKLRFDLDLLFHGAHSYVAQWSRTHTSSIARKAGVGSEKAISGVASTVDVPVALATKFADALAANPERPISSGRGWLRRYLVDPTESLAELAARNAPVPEARMRQLQVAFRHALVGDRTFDLDESSGPYVVAAKRVAERTGARVVVMGHTHLAREVSLGTGGAWYVNTGTWVDLIQCDEELLKDAKLDDFTEWVKALARNELTGKRRPHPHYAELLLNGELQLDGDGVSREAGAKARILKSWPPE